MDQLVEISLSFHCERNSQTHRRITPNADMEEIFRIEISTFSFTAFACFARSSRFIQDNNFSFRWGLLVEVASSVLKRPWSITLGSATPNDVHFCMTVARRQ